MAVWERKELSWITAVRHSEVQIREGKQVQITGELSIVLCCAFLGLCWSALMMSLYGCLRQKGEASNSKCVGEPDSSALEQLEGGELERVASACASLCLHHCACASSLPHQRSDKLNSRVALFALEEKKHCLPTN